MVATRGNGILWRIGGLPPTASNTTAPNEDVTQNTFRNRDHYRSVAAERRTQKATNGSCFIITITEVESFDN